MYYVIGSGPSGIACAAALISSGHRVTLLDAGRTLDPAREDRRTRMASRDPEEWTDQDVLASRATLDSKGQITAKLCCGSEHPYQSIPSEIQIDYGELDARGSFAKGGLSEVWGASVLPFRSADIQDWPIDASELAEAQSAVFRMLPIAARRDDLERMYPLPAARLQAAKENQQIRALMGNLARHRAQLSKAGVSFGASRLAVRFSGKSPATSCNYCGHCLHGCPRDLIYSSRHTLRALMESGKLSYIPDTIVDQIGEEEGRVVTVSATTQHGRVRFEGSRLFVAAGVFHSTALLLRSLGWYGRQRTIADSQYFLFPLLQFRAAPNVAGERLHTLAQAFVEIENESISPHLVHLQVYGFNDLLAEMLANKLGWLRRYVPQNVVLGRLLLIQGYLHSTHSGHINAVLTRQDGLSRLVLRPAVNPDSRIRVARVVRHVRRLSNALGAFPVGPLLQITQPGRSFHCGGSFPMAKNPVEGQTDTLGRPVGWSRIHVVDATIFPSIPAPTITQTVMANAFRIGSAVASGDHSGR